MTEILNGFDFDEAYKQSGPILHRYAFRLSGNADKAEELVSHAWLKFVKGLNGSHPYDPSKSKLTTYVFQIIRNLWIDELRMSRRSKTISLDDALDNVVGDNPNKRSASVVERALADYDGEPQIFVDERKELVKRAINGLPQNYQRALSLRYFKGLSDKEIAEKERLNKPTAHWRIHKAGELFKKKYLKLLGA